MESACPLGQESVVDNRNDKCVMNGTKDDIDDNASNVKPSWSKRYEAQGTLRLNIEANAAKVPRQQVADQENKVALQGRRQSSPLSQK